MKRRASLINEDSDEMGQERQRGTQAGEHALEQSAAMKTSRKTSHRENASDAQLAPLQRRDLESTPSQLLLAAPKLDSTTIDLVHHQTKVEADKIPPYIDSLPEPTLCLVFKHLDVKDAMTCKATCRRWSRVVLTTMNLRPTIIYSPLDVTANYFSRLPIELFLSIFRHLNTRDLSSCMMVCTKWNAILQSNGSLWTENVTLKGSCKELEKQLTQLCKLSGGNKSIKRMHIKRNKYYYRSGEYGWEEGCPLKEFPYSSLVDLECHWWDCLTKCPNLKILRYRLTGYNGADTYVRSVKGTPLSNCKLEECHLIGNSIRDGISCDVDEEFYSMLSEAKRIRIDYSLSEDSLYEVLNAAKDTLEDLKLVEYPRGDTIEGRPPIILKNLKSFSGEWPELSFKIEAPQLTKLAFQVCHFDPENTRLLKLYKNGITSLVLKTLYAHNGWPRESDNTLRFQPLLFDLPQCQSLEIISEEDECDMDELWESFASGTSFEDDKVSMKDFLPRLKELTVHLWGGDDGGLKSSTKLVGKFLLDFLLRRSQVGLPNLEKLVLINCLDFKVDVILRLQQMVSNFTVRLNLKKAPIDGYKEAIVV